MFKKSFMGKIILPTVIVLIVLVVALTGYSSYKFSNYNNSRLYDELMLTRDSLKDYVEGLKNDSKLAAVTMAADLDLVDALKKQDTNKIIEVLTSTLDLFHVNYFTVCDNTGTVLARTHAPSNYGDSVLHVRNIKEALDGDVMSYFEAAASMKVTAHTGSPIYDEDGTIIGVISAGVRLDTDEFVDYIKSVYKVETTIFHGNERVATTIIQDGKRVVGTTLNPDIAKIVLDQKQEYHGEADILGNKYKTVYIPMLNADNNAFAILFVGNSMSAIMEYTSIFIRDGIIIGVVVLIISIALLIFIVGKISKPILILSEDLNNIAEGNLGININVKTKDEIGRLGLALQKVVNTIRRLLDDINITVTERENGNLDYFISTEGFNGDYKKLADNILLLINTSHKDTMSLLDILTEFNNGNFNADLPKQPGKKIIINQKVDKMRKNMQNLRSEIVNLTSQAINGNLSARADSASFNGDWKAIVNGLNELLSDITEPIQEAAQALGEMSTGNLHTRITKDYKGDYAIIKESLNTTAKIISSYVNEISHVLNELANNNLDQEIKREYMGDFKDIKYSLTNIFKKLNEVIEGIKMASEQVSAGAKQMADSSADITRGAAEQASSIQQLSATVTIVNEKTGKNAENAKRAETLSNLSNENALLGNGEMKKMLNAMNEIKDSSNNISKIIKVIEDIAFQTNLLALNAAVEAARAGEQGKGFSVVAEEVRSLAARSQSAARETTQLIKSSIQKVDEGFGIAQATATALEKIVSNITEVSSIILEISTISEDQAQAISQINEGVSQISQVVQANSATSEENASSSEELSSQSEVLNDMIKVFNLKKK